MKNLLMALVMAACAVITVMSPVPVISKVIVLAVCAYGVYLFIDRYQKNKN